MKNIRKIKLLTLNIIQKNSKIVDKWNNCEFSNEANQKDYDYYMINNMATESIKDNYYSKDKCIVSHHEPWIYNKGVNYGVHTWKYWKDANDILHLHNHKNYLNISLFLSNQSEIEKYGITGIEKTKNNVICTIQSDKYNDIGQKKRLDFIKFLENKGINIDVYGTNRKYVSYKGKIPYIKNGLDDRRDCMKSYKYYLHGENNYEFNYITEKLMEPIMNECLVFYFAGPNVNDYFNPNSYVELDKNDFEKSYQIVKKAIEENWYEKRYQFILQEKKRVLEIYSLAPTVENITNYYDIFKNKNVAYYRKKICMIHLNQNQSEDDIEQKCENIIFNLKCTTFYQKIDYIIIQNKNYYNKLLSSNNDISNNDISNKIVYMDLDKFSTSGKYQYHLLYNFCMFERDCEILYIDDNNYSNMFINQLDKHMPMTFDIIISNDIFYTKSYYFYKCNITLDNNNDILISGYNVNQCNI